MKKLILLSLNLLMAVFAFTQGCVAVRSVTGVSPNLVFENIKPTDKLIFNITNRYFEASKSFKEDKLFSDTLVTNRIYTLGISALRILKNGWSLGIVVPFSANSRTNGADHRGPLSFPKHTTRSFGLGDIRFSAYKWLLDPIKSRKGNIQAGLGVKLPTGDYKYEDYFYRKEDSTVLAPVDQAIQLGDGGTGITAELSAFYSLTKKINVFVNGFYLINPRDQNGVSNLKGRTPTPAQISNKTTVMSVPDQYTFRVGANLQFQKLALYATLKYEKVPSKDLIGGNKGFRRVSSITSLEPGITYKIKNVSAFVNVGVPIKRKIVLNTQNDMTPAGFANCIVYFGVQFKF